MFVAIVEIGPEGHYCAVRFTDREIADAWCDRNDAEILGWAPLMSRREAIELGAHRTREHPPGIG